MYARLTGYAPDADPATPGIIRDGENIIPSPAGFRSAYAPVNARPSNLTATCVGAVSIVDLAGNATTFAGTSTELFAEDGDHWTAVTRASGDYTSGTSWLFAQQGNATYAANDSSVLQKYTSGTFADVSGGPVAKILVSAQNQLLAFDTNEATFGDSPNRWWCSALGNPDSWIPSIATQSASGIIVDTEGPITAAGSIGDRVVLWKENSMYMGTQIGPPSVWAWPLVSDQVGCVGPRAHVSAESLRYFMGRNDFYVFNGTYPQPIGAGIKEFFFQEEIDRTNASATIAIYNRIHGVIYFFYVSSSATDGKINRYITYHIRSQLWGPPTDLSVQMAFEYIAPGITYETLGDFYATYDDLPSIAYDNPFWSSVTRKSGVFSTGGRLQTLDGNPDSGSLTLWVMGADDRYSFFKRLRPRFVKAPTSATMTNSYQEDAGGTWVSDSPVSTMVNGKFDIERESRWHCARIAFSGEMELAGVDATLLAAGDE